VPSRAGPEKAIFPSKKHDKIWKLLAKKIASRRFKTSRREDGNTSQSHWHRLTRLCFSSEARRTKTPTPGLYHLARLNPNRNAHPLDSLTTFLQYIYIFINAYIYTFGCWSKILDPGTAILRELKCYFRETFANSMFIFRRPMLANNNSYEDSFPTCQITPENHGSLLGVWLSQSLAFGNLAAT
jgi:hypothetical protein